MSVHVALIEEIEMLTRIWVEHLNERDHADDLGADRRIIC